MRNYGRSKISESRKSAARRRRGGLRWSLSSGAHWHDPLARNDGRSFDQKVKTYPNTKPILLVINSHKSFACWCAEYPIQSVDVVPYFGLVDGRSRTSTMLTTPGG